MSHTFYVLGVIAAAFVARVLVMSEIADVTTGVSLLLLVCCLHYTFLTHFDPFKNQLIYIYQFLMSGAFAKIDFCLHAWIFQINYIFLIAQIFKINIQYLQSKIHLSKTPYKCITTWNTLL